MTRLLARLHGLASAERWLRSPVLLDLFGVLVVACVGVGLLRQSWPIALLPFGLLAVLALALIDVRVVWLLLLAILPLSMHVDLPGGLSIDLPSEPLMLLLLGLLLARMLVGKPVGGAWMRHPVTVIIGLQLVWATLSGLQSVDGIHSLKYLLAKVWYLAAFFVASGMVLRRPADVRLLLLTFLPLTVVTVLYAIVRHAASGFAFSEVTAVIQPFYANHVIYATTLALFLPYVYFGPRFGPMGTGARSLLRIGLLVLLAGVVLAYTRASWGAVVLAGGYYVAVRWRLVRPIMIALLLATGLSTVWLVQDQHYLRFAPDFEKTIWHGDNLSAHLESTYAMQDVSGMERVYRWVAAARMVAARPWTGAGPSTFYPEYRHFTDKRFRTYVSDNPEHSTTHNYFLLQLAEQGIPGLLLFVALVWWALVLPQTLYHRTRDPHIRGVVLAAGTSLFIIIFHLTLNELVEVDKIGSFFFIGLALLLRADQWTRADAAATGLAPADAPTLRQAA